RSASPPAEAASVATATSTCGGAESPRLCTSGLAGSAAGESFIFALLLGRCDVNNIYQFCGGGPVELCEPDANARSIPQPRADATTADSAGPDRGCPRTQPCFRLESIPTTVEKRAYMPVNTERQGASFSLPEPYEVSREAIAEFARATGAKADYHYDAEAATALGYRDVVAPTTFAVIIAQKSEAAYVADPESGIDFSKVVHGSEQFSFTRPIVAGDLLSAVTHVDGIRAAGDNAMITTRTELTDAAQQPVVTVTSTLVVRGDGE